MNYFNGKGELNASNAQDAIQQLVKIATMLQENVPSNIGFGGQPSMSDEKKGQLMEIAMNTHEGKLALAQAMANPIRK